MVGRKEREGKGEVYGSTEIGENKRGEEHREGNEVWGRRWRGSDDGRVWRRWEGGDEVEVG